MAEKGVQVIDRAFDILELLSQEKDGLGITEISLRLSLNKSTVHRIVSALAGRGYIEKSSSSYCLGLKFVEMGSMRLNSIELKTEARPFLRELSLKAGAPSHLGILDGIDVVYIDKVDNINNIRLYSDIGKRIPAHCSALGKALLSDMCEKDILKVFDGQHLEKLTKKTITDTPNLIKTIMNARRCGYAIDDEEHEESVRCIAAPILDYRSKIIAAISVAGSTDILPLERDSEASVYVIDAAQNISKRLGFKKLN